jgi:hypothetical protein
MGERVALKWASPARMARISRGSARLCRAWGEAPLLLFQHRETGASEARGGKAVDVHAVDGFLVCENSARRVVKLPTCDDVDICSARN